MVWLTNAEWDDAKMLLDIPFPMNYLVIDQLALNLVGICLDKTLQISCKLLPSFVKIEKIDYSKIAKIWLVKFCMFNFRLAYFTQFSTDLNNLDLEI